MTSVNMEDFADAPHPDAVSHDDRDPPVAVQVLSIIFFGAFSIVAISVAFAQFWPAGFALAVIIAWTWAGSRTFGGHRRRPKFARQQVRDLAPSVTANRTGNSSFDAYRADTLRRLEEENREFEDFLTRLREARDEMEFDQFMDDRAHRAKPVIDRGDSVDLVEPERETRAARN